MDKPRPLFAVNEEVCTCYKEFKNTARAEIINMEWDEKIDATSMFTGEEFLYTGWSYLLSDGDYWVQEKYIRRLPPLAKWEDCEFNPLKDNVGA